MLIACGMVVESEEVEAPSPSPMASLGPLDGPKHLRLMAMAESPKRHVTRPKSRTMRVRVLPDGRDLQGRSDLRRMVKARPFEGGLGGCQWDRDLRAPGSDIEGGDERRCCCRHRRHRAAAPPQPVLLCAI
jgi:hypothetical protein